MNYCSFFEIFLSKFMFILDMVGLMPSNITVLKVDKILNCGVTEQSIANKCVSFLQENKIICISKHFIELTYLL